MSLSVTANAVHLRSYTLKRPREYASADLNAILESIDVLRLGLKLMPDGRSALSRYSKHTPAQVETEVACALRSELAFSVKLTYRVRSSELAVPHLSVVDLQAQRLR